MTLPTIPETHPLKTEMMLKLPSFKVTPSWVKKTWKGKTKLSAPTLLYFALLFTSITVFATLFIWLVNKPSAPTISIQQFYVPALEKSANLTMIPNTTITLDLQLQTMATPLHYEAIYITLYYYHNLSTPIANISIPGFFQGDYSIVHRVETVETNGVPWEIARKEVSSKGTTVFKVDVSTTLTYKIFSMRGGRHEISVGGNVEVNDQGVMSGDKGLEIYSCALGCTSIIKEGAKDLTLGLAGL